MVSVLVAAALAAAPPASPAFVQSTDQPAMFVVHDGDTKIYIFGTFHALDARSQWFEQHVRDAFEQSDELVLETLVPEGPQPVQSMAPKPLRAPSVIPSASFLATTRLAINAGRSQGMQVGNGADMVLRHVAEAEGKPVEGLETLQLQIDMFSRLPATPAARSAQSAGSGSMDGLSKAMGEMQAAWKRGDQSVFVRMLGQLQQASPDTYRMMFTERNARWADWIRARMQAPGTVFVAVGAGHLAGKDSLLVRLAERGISSQRVN